LVFGFCSAGYWLKAPEPRQGCQLSGGHLAFTPGGSAGATYRGAQGRWNVHLFYAVTRGNLTPWFAQRLQQSF